MHTGALSEWGNNQPNNFDGGQFCVGTDSAKQFKLGDETCQTKVRFMCKLRKYCLQHYDLVDLSGQSLDILFGQNIDWNRGMLFLVGKIFMYGISFNMVYNESGHKSMIHFEYPFSQSSGKKSIFLYQRWRGIEQHCVVTHTYSYQIGPFKFGLLARTQHNWWVIFAGV